MRGEAGAPVAGPGNHVTTVLVELMPPHKPLLVAPRSGLRERLAHGPSAGAVRRRELKISLIVGLRSGLALIPS